MNKSFVYISIVLAFFIISLTGPGVQAQDKEKKLIETKSSVAPSGEDKNVNSNVSENDDPNSRGSGPGACYVYFENYTSWRIRIYVDGNYQGELAAYSEGRVYTGTGSTSLYGVALFKSGDKLVWGPKSIDCDYMYTWRLYY